MAAPLYGRNSPYQDGAAASNIPDSAAPWRYPLHDLLARPATVDAACIPVPQLKYRNLGVRKLAKDQTVLDTQIMRDAIKHGNSPEKVAISLFHRICQVELTLLVCIVRRHFFTPPTRLASSSSMVLTRARSLHRPNVPIRSPTRSKTRKGWSSKKAERTRRLAFLQSRWLSLVRATSLINAATRGADLSPFRFCSARSS